ncbi:hypothetical protein ADL21_13400 [Streptomyces albus subsp. albus]|nr:hypothetical protein ADL21_13400 [Streptomyces albus subsp. albus]
MVVGPVVALCGGMAGAPMAGPVDWGVFCCGCCGVVGVPALGSVLCWVGGGAVMVAADWVDTEVSLSSTVGMGSPGAGSRCWIGWPEDGECCTGVPCEGTPMCGTDGRPPPPPLLGLSELPLLLVPSLVLLGGLPATGSTDGECCWGAAEASGDGPGAGWVLTLSGVGRAESGVVAGVG